MIKSAIKTLAIAAYVVGCAPLAHAQASRTWVSGVGDDANPCSRTAPCKTFAGAISKTAAGGEINTLDPGGYGSVTITKSITIANDGNGSAGVLASGTHGIIINGAGITVQLRGLDIFGIGTTLNGIHFIQGAALHVSNCTIRNFVGNNSFGISFTPNSGASLHVSDTVIANSGTSTTGGGVLVRGTGSGNVNTTFIRVQSERNSTAFKADSSGKPSGFTSMVIRDSTAASSTLHGVWVLGGNQGADIFVSNSVVSASAQNGLRAEGTAARIIYNNSLVTYNGTGVNALSGGQTISQVTNLNRGNFSNGTPTATFPLE